MDSQNFGFVGGIRLNILQRITGTYLISISFEIKFYFVLYDICLGFLSVLGDLLDKGGFMTGKIVFLITYVLTRPSADHQARGS